MRLAQWRSFPPRSAVCASHDPRLVAPAQHAEGRLARPCRSARRPRPCRWPARCRHRTATFDAEGGPLARGEPFAKWRELGRRSRAVTDTAAGGRLPAPVDRHLVRARQHQQHLARREHRIDLAIAAVDGEMARQRLGHLAGKPSTRPSSEASSNGPLLRSIGQAGSPIVQLLGALGRAVGIGSRASR